MEKILDALVDTISDRVLEKVMAKVMEADAFKNFIHNGPPIPTSRIEDLEEYLDAHFRESFQDAIGGVTVSVHCEAELET